MASGKLARPRTISLRAIFMFLLQICDDEMLWNSTNMRARAQFNSP